MTWAWMKRSRIAWVTIGTLVGGCGSDPRTEDDPTTGGPATTTGSVDDGGSTTSSTSPPMTDDTTGGASTDTGSSSGGEASTTGEPVDGTSSESTAAADSSSSDGGASESGSTTGEEAEVTIYDIQQGVVPLPGDVVVDGVTVTGTGTTGFFAQEPEGGEYSGIFVYAGAPTPVMVGDVVDLTGTAEEYMGMTQINVTLGSINPTGITGVVVEPAIPALSVYAMEATAEPWEGVYVRNEAALTIAALPGFDEFDVSDGTDTVRIDNLLYTALDDMAAFPGIDLGAGFSAIQGPLNFSFGAYKICPRSATDLEGYQGPPPPPWTIVDLLVPGDLVVTEVMYNPTCANDDCEWIEVLNTTADEVNLEGLRIQDSALSIEGTIDTQLIVPIGGYAWLSMDDAGGWTYTAQPSAFCTGCPAFNNSGTDSVVLLNAAGILDQTAAYSAVALGNGRSWRLDPALLDSVSNDIDTNWCYSNVEFDTPGGMSEFGSPGVVNDAACAP